MIGIYKITNKVNGKCYIGQSINIQKRWRTEKQSSQNPKSKEYNKVLCKAFRKYGFENFTWEVLEECPKDFLNEREQYWVEYYNSFNEGYNSTLGGETANHTLKLTESQLDNIKYLLKDTNLSYENIGKQYNVSFETIRQIAINNNNIKHITVKERGNVIVLGKNIYISPQPSNQYHCIDCGCVITPGHNRCKPCSYKYLTAKPDPEIIKQKLNKGNKLEEIAQYFNISEKTLRKTLKQYNIIKPPKPQPIRRKINRPIYQIDLEDNIIQRFENPNEAAAYFNVANDTINKVLRGERKTGCGYKWIYAEN